MYLLTCATDPYQYESMMLCLLAKKLNYTLKICGVDWKWEGWRTKMKAYAEATKQIAEKEPDALCICTDSYDTLPVRYADDFENEFQLFNADIVCSAENHCGGNCRPLQNYDLRNAKYKNVNAGLLGGKAQALHQMWSYFYDHGYKDDQLALSEYTDNSFNNVKVDTQAKLFFNSGLAFGFDKSNYLDSSLLLGKNVFVIHFPGLNFFSAQQINYKQSLSFLLKKYNLDYILNTREPKANNILFLTSFLIVLMWAILATFYCLKRK